MLRHSIPSLALSLWLVACSGPEPVDRPEPADNAKFEEMDQLLDEAPAANNNAQ